jgi:DNA polymerase delta subunit 1
MMFAVKTAQCLGCRAAVDPQKQGGYLCQHCKPKEIEIYLAKLAVMREAELRYGELWAAAQRIHGTVHSDIMCTGDGCACQFYRRKKVQTDLRLAQEVLDKFGR